MLVPATTGSVSADGHTAIVVGTAAEGPNAMRGSPGTIGSQARFDPEPDQGADQTAVDPTDPDAGCGAAMPVGEIRTGQLALSMTALVTL